VGHVVPFVATGMQNIDALFFMLGWDRYGFHKNMTGRDMLQQTCVSPFGMSSRNSAMGHATTNLRFCIRWDLRGHVVHFDASGAR
jgi:hypothetical protein